VEVVEGELEALLERHEQVWFTEAPGFFGALLRF
jgi:hypothetical protein